MTSRLSGIEIIASRPTSYVLFCRKIAIHSIHFLII